MKRIVWLLAVAMLCPLVWATPGDDGREMDKQRRRIEELRHAAEVAADKGQHDRARELAHKARAIEEELEAQARHGEHRHGDVNLREVLEGLEHGIVALERIGKREEAAHLREIAQHVRNRMRETEGNRREREIAEQRLEVFRLAHHAFREAEKKDAADLMEHAIHALELGLAGRRDEEARRIRESAPKLGAQIELLLFAGKLWDEFGHERKAAICTKMGKELQEIWRRKQRGKEQGIERTAKRIEELEARLKRMERALEEIEELLRRRQRD